MTYKLYAAPQLVSPGTKIEFFLKFIDLKVESVYLAREEWKKPEYLAKHPLGKIPTLETPEGCIYESNSILRYLARKAGKYYGNTPAETASIDQWLEFLQTQLSTYSPKVLYPTFGFFPVSKEQFENGKKELLELLKHGVESRLKDHEFLSGNELTLADISLFHFLRTYFVLIFDEKSRSHLTGTLKWFQHIASLPQATAYFGKTWLCTKEYYPEFVGAEKKEEKQKPAEKT